MAWVGFGRIYTTIFEMNIGNIHATDKAGLHVNENVRVNLGKPNSLSVNYHIKIDEDADVIVPTSVTVERRGKIQLCGILRGIKKLKTRDNGEVSIAKPAKMYYTQAPGVTENIVLVELTVDYLGKLTINDECNGITTTNLKVTKFKKVPEFVLPSDYNLDAANEEIIHPKMSVLPLETPCSSLVAGLALNVGRKQICYLLSDTYNYNSITIEPEGEIRLFVNDTTKTTKLKVKSMTIKLGGKFTGVGVGFEQGPGAGLGVNQGGSHGGLGSSVTDINKVYGDMTLPYDYGSGGYGANQNGGKGGGQVHLKVTNILHVDGLIDMSGADKSSSSNAGGGSGGSIYVEASQVTGM